MAVGIKSSESYGYSLLHLFGVELALIAKAKNLGVEINQTSPGNFVVSAGGTVYGSIPIKGSAITMAKSGGLGPASKKALKYNFESILGKAIAAHKDNDLTTVPVEEVVGTVLLKEGFSFSSDADLEGESLLAPQTIKTGGSKVDLYHATELYQPVAGTSNGSIYKVFAMFKGLNLALRYTGSKLSFRAEGPSLKSYSSALTALGFSIKADYASVHFEVSTTDMLLKTTGALLGRMGIHNALKIGAVSTAAGVSYGS